MSDREPRRRKKRKDSAKKDDMRSDNIYLPVHTENKDSDQEVEEEVTITIHQPSTFAKIVFVILFSGLILSMSFIFISLHGAERGAVDLFDDHHTEEHASIESLEQNHTESLSVDQIENSEHSEDAEHEETEPWSSDFFTGNLMNMLPEIGNIFNTEKVEEIHDEVGEQDSPSVQEEKTEKDISQESTIHPENEKNLNPSEIDIESNIVFEHSSDYADHATQDQQDLDDDFEQLLEEKVTESFYTEQVTEPTVDTTTYHNSQESTYEEEDPYDQNLEDIPSSTFSPDVSSEQIVEQEYDSELLFSDKDVYDEPVQESTTENDDAASDYDEDILYEKASITNEEDYNIREELDSIDSMIDENLSDESHNIVRGDDNDDDDEDDENDNENEDEFDFWQF